MWQRLFSIIIKEFIQLRRDRRSMAMILVLPVIQMAILGYVVRTDIKDVSLVVWDASNTPASRELIDSFIPLTYYPRILRGIVVKGVGIEHLWQEAAILAAMTAVTLIVTAAKVRKSLD